MSTIIAGRFDQQTQAQDAIDKLQAAGFSNEKISSFFVNPAGQHGAFPIGGDRPTSPGAKETGKGVAAGAAAGAAVGAAAASVVGPVGTVTGGLVGAHVGGLMGSLSQTEERNEKGEANDVENTQPQRKAGMLVAVSVADEEHEGRALDVLRSLGAVDLERNEGTIENGDWSDFNPVAPLRLIQPGAERRA